MYYLIFRKKYSPKFRNEGMLEIKITSEQYQKIGTDNYKHVGIGWRGPLTKQSLFNFIKEKIDELKRKRIRLIIEEKW